ncbi:MAG: transcription antitermination factor NusB [Acetobacteraceae bacterium]
MHDPTREAAFDLISAVLDRHRPLEDALDRLPASPARDKAAAHRLAASVLRRLGSLDAVLEPMLRKPPPAPVRHVLRLGAAALLLLETPAHAAVATGVALVRARGLAPFAGLVNAVLRRLAREGSTTLAEIDGPRADTPDWLWESWGVQARAIGSAHQAPAPIDLTKRAGTDSPPVGVQLPTGSIRVPAGTRVAELSGYSEGTFWVQDVAASLPARLLNVRADEYVADLCAAPGGKTAQLAATGARVVAVERDAGRIGRLRENLARLRLAVEIVQADAAEWEPPGLLDAVLLDAPCSATGTIRRHPDVARLKGPEDVRSATTAQDRLLGRAGRLLRPGGRLVYAVCSLQQDEGRPRIEQLLAGGGWRPDPFTPEELADMPEARTLDGYLRTHPGMWAERGGMDGFFAARLVRV